ncbi:MAG: calponin homology domain-containing protein [Benjaminiella poitrasii]|nr:MAG: calponin homology domain-containing protein [Benjaminiella poitrasii]KAI9470723.1 MAG: calponin homology domain-containing protein [Benjaminiella poitrasii]
MSRQQIIKSKNGADLQYDKMKLEQYKIDEEDAINYLNTTLDVFLTEPLHQALRDGVLLCNLVNKIQPGTVKQIGYKDLSFVKMDNISRFLQGAKKLGLNNAQLFETIDLFEAKDMTAVVHTILSLSRLSEKQQEEPSQELQTPEPHLLTDSKVEIEQTDELPETQTSETEENDLDKVIIHLISMKK